MDRRELLDDPVSAMLAALDGMRADIWTALPGIIQSFDPAEKVCSVQPAIQARLTDPVDGQKTWVNLPVLHDCPVFFPSGGGCTLTFPIKKDDECLIIFASRCIDGWWQDGKIQQQTQIRMHDLSDGFVFVGISSLKNIPVSINTSSTELRAHDGETFIRLDPTTQEVTITAPGGITINGDVTVNGTVTSSEDVLADTISLKTHTHGGVQTGSGNTGVPNP